MARVMCARGEHQYRFGDGHFLHLLQKGIDLFVGGQRDPFIILVSSSSSSCRRSHEHTQLSLSPGKTKRKGDTMTQDSPSQNTNNDNIKGHNTNDHNVTHSSRWTPLSLMQSLWNRYDTFLFARTRNGGRIVGWMRMAYALLYLYDGWVWSFILPAYFHPTTGLVSYAVGRQSSYFSDQYDDNDENESWGWPLAFNKPWLWSVYQVAPNSMDWVWWIHGLALMQAALLLVGIAPRLQLVELLVHQGSLHHHNRLLWDAQDVMLRLWTWMLLLLPLQDNTIFTWMRDWNQQPKRPSNPTNQTNQKNTKTTKTTKTKANQNEEKESTNQQKEGEDTKITTNEPNDKKSHTLYKKPQDDGGNNDDDTWPMWPFRLFQIEMTVIYLGAGHGKWDGTVWTSGLAVYALAHTWDRYPGIWTPDWLFNRLGPLQVMAWFTLGLELMAPITLWIPRFRKPTLCLVILLHVGMEVALNMHLFESLTILGFCSFLVDKDKKDKNQSFHQPNSQQSKSPHRKNNTLENTGTSSVSKSPSTSILSSPTSTTPARSPWRIAAHVGGHLVFLFLATIIVVGSLPVAELNRVWSQWFLGLPESSLGTVLQQGQYNVMQGARPVVQTLALEQHIWTLYGGSASSTNRIVHARITLIPRPGQGPTHDSLPSTLTTDHTNTPQNHTHAMDDDNNNNNTHSHHQSTTTTEENNNNHNHPNAMVLHWYSPDWMALTWWERKLAVRDMNYYTHLMDGWEDMVSSLDNDNKEEQENDDELDPGLLAAWTALGHALIREYSSAAASSSSNNNNNNNSNTGQWSTIVPWTQPPTIPNTTNTRMVVQSVNVGFYTDYAVAPPNRIGFWSWEPVRQPMDESEPRRPVATLHVTFRSSSSTTRTTTANPTTTRTDGQQEWTDPTDPGAPCTIVPTFVLANQLEHDDDDDNNTNDDIGNTEALLLS